MNLKSTKLVTLKKSEKASMPKEGRYFEHHKDHENNLTQVYGNLDIKLPRETKEGVRFWKIPVKSIKKNGVKEWSRIDKNRDTFVTSWDRGGPHWSTVISRTTYDMNDGRIIQHMVIDDYEDFRLLAGKLPEGVKHIKTVVLYRDV